MRTNRSRAVRAVIAGALVAFLTVVGSSALTASNTVADSNAGDGTGNVSGFDVTNISYDLNATNPQNIDEVSFTLDVAADEVEVRLDSSTTTWYSCDTSGGTSITCDTTGTTIAVADVDEVRVVAVD